jgi:hypothetical protein
MDLTSLTYTSLARHDLQQPDLEDIHRTARERNSANGITGLLIFNGTHFLQIVEGSHASVDELIGRLRSDPRHSGLEVRDQHKIGARSFPDQPMNLLRVRPGVFEARDVIAESLPDTVPEEIRLRLFRMTELISRMEF